jgi:hypothetical protein
MPYISAEKRDELKSRAPRDAGELNYELTMFVRTNAYIVREHRLVRMILAKVQEYLAAKPRQGYTEFNEVLGVLSAACFEHNQREWWHGSDGARSVFDRAARQFYDGVVAPYEERKIVENGDMLFVF